MRGRVGSEAPYRTLSPVVVVLHGNRLDVRDDHASPWRPHPFVAVAIVLGRWCLVDLTPLLVVVPALATVLGLRATIAAHRGRRLAEDLSRLPSVGQIACAVADALLDAELSPLGSAGVRVLVDEDGGSRCAIDGVDPLIEGTFATALDEVLSAMLAPRYVVPHRVLQGSATDAGLGAGRAREDATPRTGMERRPDRAGHRRPARAGVRTRLGRLGRRRPGARHRKSRGQGRPRHRPWPRPRWPGRASGDVN
jgi:hypothetical protein